MQAISGEHFGFQTLQKRNPAGVFPSPASCYGPSVRDTRQGADATPVFRQEAEMSLKKICRPLLVGVAMIAMAATVSAQAGAPGVKAKAELEQLAEGLRSGKLTGDHDLFSGGSRYTIDTSYFSANHKATAQAHVDTDEVFMVLSGSAQVTLGGELEGKFFAKGDKNQPRGTGIKGGTTWRVAQGDLVSIPQGTPHHVDPADGYIVYAVIKIHGKQ
jgi:mannose-6-phosphate isomerase-like protein (cupin superfamily)